MTFNREKEQFEQEPKIETVEILNQRMEGEYPIVMAKVSGPGLGLEGTTVTVKMGGDSNQFIPRAPTFIIGYEQEVVDAIKAKLSEQGGH